MDCNVDKIWSFFLPILLCCTAVNSFAQPFAETKDIKDVIRYWKGDTTPSGPPEMQVGKKYFSILPVVGYAPANGFLVGTTVCLSQLLAPAPTSLSSVMLNMQLTSKRQFITSLRSKIYLKDNRWFFQGDWRLMFFTQPTYGLGINNIVGEQFLLAVNNLSETTVPNAEPMKFNYVRFYEDVVRRLGDGNFYLGLGLAIDHHYAIVDEKLNTDITSSDYYITEHYAYSIEKKFNPEQYTTTGINLNVLTDTRDVIANPYSGYFASLAVRVNPELSKNSQSSLMLSYDVRYYWGLSKERKRRVLSFWSWGTFVSAGEVPYLALPSIGWDTYNRSGRGYIQGRYRGLSMVYAETEYRFPISRDGLWGGVVFLNCTFASGPEQQLFEKAAPGVGVGVRLKMDKLARVNLTADIGVGLDKSSGIYFGMQEVF